jgi:hypothetical protein
LIQTKDLSITLADVVTILSSRQFKYHLTGGFAASFYGEPRFTQDIDIVIRIFPDSPLDQLISDLSKKFIINPEAIEDAVRRKSLFQALHEETMIKVDFHVGEAIVGELDRSKEEEILTGIVIPLVSKEDAIISKLIWIKKGSHKSRQDIKMMLKRGGEIDLQYLEMQALRLGVDHILNELKAELYQE